MENIEGCTKAKSVLNTLGPIAKQVVELKSRHGMECEASTVLGLLHQCTVLKAACQHLMECLLFFAQQYNHHQLATLTIELQKELQDAVEEVTDATRNLHMGDVGVCNTEEVWSSLVECAENLLSILMSALLAWDNANIQQVEFHIDNFTKVMENLKEIRLVQGIPDAFQEVVDAAFSLFSTLERRCADLYRKQQQETVQMLSLQLHHMLPLLAVSAVACVQHPISKCLKSSREVVISRLRDVLKDLKEHSGQGIPHYDVEEPGIFVKHVDKVLEILVEAGAGQTRTHVNEKVRAPLEEVLRHAIAVAHSSCEQDKEVIMAMCENVLKQLRAIAALEHSGFPDAVDIHVSCDILTDCLELLEQGVNTALIRLIVQTMADPFAPIKTLVETLHPKDTNIPVDRKTLQAKIEEFDQHIDDLLLVGGFAIACTTDTKRVLQIRDVMLTLEWLETCLISGIVTAHAGMITISKGDLCQQENWIHAQMLIKHWKRAIRQLKECFDFLLDPPAFTMVSKEEMHRTWAEVKGSLYTQDMAWLSHRVHYTRAVISHLLDLHKATPFLSGMQVDDIELVVEEITSHFDSVLKAPEDHARRRSLLKRLQFALTVVSRLSSSLNEDNSAIDVIEEQNPSQNHTSEQAQQNPYCKLSDMDKKTLVTSNIEDIPVDVNTPVPTKQEPTSRPPLPTLPRGAFLQNQLLPPLPKSTRSLIRLGEVRGKGGSSASSVFAGELPPGIVTAENTVGTDISIDISKFLSRSSNAFHCSSTRASRRNFSLKVREIQVNLGEFVKEPKEYQEVVQHLNETKSEREEDKQEAQFIMKVEEKSVIGEPGSQARELKVESQPDSPKLSNISSSTPTTLPSLLSSSSVASSCIQASLPSTFSSLKDVSALIAQNLTVNPNISTRTSPEEELSEILENLTSLAGSLSTLVSLNESEETRSETVIVAGNRNLEAEKGYSVSAEEGQGPFKTEQMSIVGVDKVGCSPLKGIIINNASFTPEFPSIKLGDTTQEVFHDVSGHKKQGFSTHEPLEFSRMSSNSETSIWQDFTAILEAVTPAKSKLLNFTDNFSEAFEGWFTRLTTPFRNQENSKDKTASPVVPRKTLSPFNDANYVSSNSCSPSTSKLMSAGASVSSVRANSLMCSLTSSLPSNISISSASVGISTPQRICDLHAVNQRLATLKGSLE